MVLAGSNEALIERYIAFPESLDPQTRSRIEAEIRNDRAAREIAEFYRSYYDELRRGAPPDTGRK